MMRAGHAANRSLPCTLLLLLSLAALADDGPLKNWFNDPFLSVRSAIPRCPAPLGPWVSEADMRKESHWRTERGNSCWVAGKCKRANAYLYDHDIAQDLQQRFAHSSRYRRSSLWLTVQRRIVWVEGCVAGSSPVGGLEAFVRQTPDVELVVLNITRLPAKPTYPLAPADVVSRRQQAAPP